MPHKSSRAQGGKGSASPSHAQNQSTGSPQQPPSAQLRAQWFRAAKCGHVPSLRAALEANQALLHLKGAGVGHTALHWAAAAGHISAVKWLLDTGSCPGTLNSVGSTPLHAAAAHGHTDVVRELLGRSRCDPHVVNDDGDTALQVRHTLSLYQYHCVSSNLFIYFPMHMHKCIQISSIACHIAMVTALY